jgi:hypothetical protein
MITSRRLAPVLAHLVRLAIASGLFAFVPLRAADESGAADASVVELPKVEVYGTRDLPKPESWRYAQFGVFEVLSNASDKGSQALLKDFRVFQQALNMMWSVPIKPATSSTLILCGSGGKFDQFLPPKSDTPDADTASLFFGNRDHRAIVIDLQTRDITLEDQGTFKQFEVEANQQLYHEYIHFLFSQGGDRPPAWLEEGLAQIAMSMEISEKSVRFGFIDSTRFPSRQVGSSVGTDDEGDDPEPETSVANRPFNVALSGRQLMKMDKFFAVEHGSAAAINTVGNNLWAKQAYAFVHLCLYGHKRTLQKPFGQFLKRLGSEPPSEALFKECFGKSYNDMLLLLRGYVNTTTFEFYTAEVKPGQELRGTAPEFREATQAEIGRIKGDALLLAGRKEQAHAEYLNAYLRGERDARLLAALGLSESSVGETARARKFLEAAAKQGVAHPAAHIELARLRLAEAVAAPGGKDGISAQQLANVLDPLFTARKQAPPLRDTYETIGEAWSRSAVPPKADNLSVLDEGAQLFPRDAALIYSAASVNAKFGFHEKAAALAKFGLLSATDADTKKRLQALLDTLPAEPAPKA